MRSTLVAVRLAERLDLDPETAAQSYYACLLQQVGCTADIHVREVARKIPRAALVMPRVDVAWPRSCSDVDRENGLTDPQREAMGREVSAIAAPDATLLLDCFAPAGEARCRAARAAPMWSEPSPGGR